LQGGVKPVDALPNDCLNGHRQRFRIKTACLNPVTTIVPNQSTLFLHIPQQFNSKERMSASMPKQSFPEHPAQSIRFAIQQGVNKGAALSAF
jgi:hypothetical protein